MTITARSTYEQDSEGRWVILKDPSAVLDYSLDWSKWLARAGTEIDTFTAILPEDSELTLVSQAVAGGVTTAVVSGGTTIGSLQAVTYRIETATGLIDERTIYLKIVER